jgi:CRP/FNR family transcriptional regulator
MHVLCEAADPIPRGLPAVDARRKIARGDVLFHAGDRRTAVFAIRAGFLKLCAPVDDSEPHIVRFLMPGDAAGLEGFGRATYATTAIALEDTEVCEISIRRAQAMCDSYTHLAAQTRRLLALELAQSQAHGVALAHRSAPQRIAAFLVELGDRWAKRGYSSTSFRLPMERREIADYLGLTIETVSRVLGQFRDQGWATTVGREVTIHDRERLAGCPRQF